MSQAATVTSSYSNEYRMPTTVRIVFAVLLLWGLFSVYIYYISNGLSETQLAALPEPARLLYLDIPLWAVISGAVSGIASLIGLALAVVGKKQAVWFLTLALLGVLARDGWFIYDGRVWELISRLSLILSSSFVIISALQLALAIYGIRKNWLT